MLDSIWLFYNPSGDTLKKINYLYGVKNGYYFTFDYDNPNRPEGFLLSKELYVNDKKEGVSYYYYPDNKVKEEINYNDGKRSGRAFEFNREGKIITVFDYNNGRLVNKEPVNRIDDQGNKVGVWKEFYGNKRVKTEKRFKKNKPDGYFKEYDDKGKLIITIRYKDGVIVENNAVDEQEKVEIRKEYYDNGNVKASGPYKENIPVGIHREYSIEGEIINSKIYDNNGNVVSTGIVNEQGEKQGNWKNYYKNEKLLSEGSYADNDKTGKWNYYFENGRIEQTGMFRNGKPFGIWKWYNRNGDLLREEEYFNGKRDGSFTEYSKEGKIISKGFFLDGEKDGDWRTKVGDHSEVGNYIVGLRNETWKYYYIDGSVKFTGNYVNGNPDGRHKLFWKNGNVKEERYYENGIREKTWKKYTKEGNLKLTITYKDDMEYRVNGVKLNLPEEKVKLIK